jgi:hypothetical protein
MHHFLEILSHLISGDDTLAAWECGFLLLAILLCAVGFSFYTAVQDIKKLARHPFNEAHKIESSINLFWWIQ